MTRALTLMQGKQSNELFTWKGADPSTRKILEGGSLKCHSFLRPNPLPPAQTGAKARESLLGGGAKRRMTFQSKKADHASAIMFSVYSLHAKGCTCR